MRKKFYNQTIILFIIVVIFFYVIPSTCLTKLFPKAIASDFYVEIPPAFSLEDSPLMESQKSGLWQFALRETDGYAVIIGYTGVETDISIPAQLDGYDVIGIASNALSGKSSIRLHGNILYIAPDAFGSNKPTIISPNGTYGLYWAYLHEFTYSTGRDYDLVPGVIDFTDAIKGRIQKRGDDYILFGKLEASRLSVGSLIWITDSRGLEYFYRITSLVTQSDGVLANIITPEKASDVIINYKAENEITLNMKDFIPAEGVFINISSPSSKTISEDESSDSTSLTVTVPVKAKKWGNNEAKKSEGTISATGTINNKVKYKIYYTNGEPELTELIEKQSYGLDIEYSHKYTDDLIKEASSAMPKGDKVDKPLLEKIGIQINTDDESGTYSKEEIEKVRKEVQKYIDNITNKSHVEEEIPLGIIKLQTSLFNISFEVKIKISISGSVKYSYKCTNITKKHYDYIEDDWVVDYSNGHSTTSESEHAIKIEAKGTASLAVEISGGFLVTKSFSAELEYGIELKAIQNQNLSFDTGLACLQLSVDPYASLHVYAGLWVGKFGYKHQVYEKKWTAWELFGSEHFMHVHHNFSLEQDNFHLPDQCPLEDTCIISYNTRTSLNISDKKIIRGGLLRERYNVYLEEHPLYGQFLGWSMDESTLTPVMFVSSNVSDSESDLYNDRIISKNTTLYAIWENQVQVTFNTDGGNEIAAQFVPIHGYIIEPVSPYKEGYEFLSWKNSNGDEWNFDTDFVTGATTLTAVWTEGEVSIPITGTTNPTYIGNIADVSSDCLFDPIYFGQKTADYFTYSEIPIEDDVKQIYITGVKNNPTYLVIPDKLPSLSIGDSSMLKVGDISRNAFRNCDSLKCVYFLTDIQLGLESTYCMFSGCDNLEYVELPRLQNGITGENMFENCPNLKCIKFQAGLTKINSGAFYNCKSIRGLIDLKDFSTIGNHAFYGCSSIEAVNIGNKLREIPDSLFCDCSGITTLNLEGSVDTIGASAFKNCTSLTKLYIPDNVKQLAGHFDYQANNASFKGCNNIEEINVGGICKIEYNTLPLESTNLKKIIIRGTVKTIGEGAFSTVSNYCIVPTALRTPGSNVEITICEGVETIEYSAFSQCTGAIFNTFPSSLHTIGNSAFGGCTGITGALDLSNIYDVGIGAFGGCTGITSVNIGNRIAAIPDFMFRGCSGISHINLGRVKTIGGGAFYDCTGLTELYLPDTLKTINIGVYSIKYSLMNSYEQKEYPFYGCTNIKQISVGGLDSISLKMLPLYPTLEEVTIRSTVKAVGSRAFSYEAEFDSLRIIIEEGVERIESYAFDNPNITSINFPSSIQYVGWNAFTTPGLIGSVDLSHVTVIEAYAFSECDGITSVVLGHKIKTIPGCAFRGCTSITDFDFGNVEIIEGGAFKGCTGLTYIYLPDTLQEIKKTVKTYDGSYFTETYPFTDCTNIKKINIGGIKELTNNYLPLYHALDEIIIRGTVKTIAASAFANNVESESLTIHIEEGVEKIQEYAFDNPRIIEINLPSSVTSIARYSFSTSGLKGNIDLSNVNHLEEYAFSECTEITSVTIGNTIKAIPEHLFDGCNGITHINLGTVENIGAGAFWNCSSLLQLHLPDTLKIMTKAIDYHTRTYEYPFYECTAIQKISVGGLDTVELNMLPLYSSLKEVTIRESVKNIGNSAFMYKANYDSLTIYIENGVETIGAYAFNDNRIVSVYLPGTISYIDNTVFSHPIACSVILTSQNLYLEDYLYQHNIEYQYYTSMPFTLTLVNNSGCPDNIYTMYDNVPFDLPVPVREGFIFTGWYEDENLKNPTTIDRMPAYNLTLFAGWQQAFYNLTVVISDNSKVYPTEINKPIDVFIPNNEGYSFVGWSFDEAGHIPFDGNMPAEDITIYAQWVPESVNGKYRFEDDHVVLTGYRMFEDDQKTVYLPETVAGLPLTVIAAGAFDNVDVETVFISSTVSTIETGAFTGADHLSSINVSAANLFYQSNNGILYSKDLTRLIAYPPAGARHINVPIDVIEISAHAFDHTALSSISLPQTLLTIGEHAFRSTNIQYIILPSSLEKIGEFAFCNCHNLAYVEAKKSPSEINETVFSGCNPSLLVYGPDEDCPLRTVVRNLCLLYNAHSCTIHYLDRTISHFLQAGSNLILPENPNLGENQQFTGWYTDENCNNILESLIMPKEDLTLWAGSSHILDYEIVTTNEGLSGLRITECNALSKQVSVPESINNIPVLSIAQGSFSAKYTSVTLPESIIEIENGAFSDKTTLIFIPGSYAADWIAANHHNAVEKKWTISWETGFDVHIGEVYLYAGSEIIFPTLIRTGYSFSGWYIDQEMTEVADTIMPAANIVLYAKWNIEDEDLVALLTDLQWNATETGITITDYTGDFDSLEIPSEINGKPVTAIAPDAFSYNNVLKSIIMPSSIISIGNSAFRCMIKLESIILSPSLTEIPDNTFEHCIALKHIDLPQGIKVIGSNAFENTALTQLTLPASLTTISATALYNCNSLRYIDVSEGNLYYESHDGVLIDTVDSILVRYPAARNDNTYTVEDVWSIGAWAFQGASNLETIELSDDIYSLGEGAFAHCIQLKFMPQISSMVTRIPEKCFYGCTNMTTAEFTDSIKHIGSRAFVGTSIDKLILPDSVLSIGTQAVDSSIVLYGTSESYARIWALSNNISFIPLDTVTIDSIHLYSNRITIYKNTNDMILLEITPEGASLEGITYCSLDTRIAEVDENGTIYGINCGETMIFITAPGGATAYCQVSVQEQPIAPEEIIISTAIPYMAVGDILQVHAEILPAEAESALQWSSSDPEIVYISEHGEIIATGTGTAIITATTNNHIEDSLEITVTSATNTLTLPLSLQEIEEEAFASIPISYLLIPENCTTLGSRSFADCTKLHVVVIPASVNYIAEDAFQGCSTFIIITPKDSYAMEYAHMNSIGCILSQSIK